MDHKKIPLGSSDIEKLKALLRKEEELVDAMSDEELAQAERDLEARIKKLPQMAKGSDSSSEKDLDEGWKKLQKKLETPKIEAPLNVVPLPQKKKALPWATVGVLAAAALALLIFYPALRQNQISETGDLSQMQTKGSDPGLKTDCEIEFVGAGELLSQGPNAGQGYAVDPSGDFPLKVYCHSQGYLHVWNTQDPDSAVLNAKIEKGQSTLVHKGDEVAQFRLAGKPKVALDLFLTDKPIATGEEFRTALSTAKPGMPPEIIGSSNVLWSDRVILEEKK